MAVFEGKSRFLRSGAPGGKKQKTLKSIKTIKTLKTIETQARQGLRGFVSLRNPENQNSVFQFDEFFTPATFSNVFDPLAPTCPEEAEGLNAAPPWAGCWLQPPTIKQRVRNWTRYANYLAGKTWRGATR